MQKSRVIAALCLLNLALVGLAGYLWVLYNDAKNEKKVEVQTKFVTNVVRKVVVRNPDLIDTNPPVLFRRWRDLESTDYRIYIRNLRAFGCPDDVIQDIIVADVGRLYDEKRREFLAANPPKYWKGYDKEVYEGFKKIGAEQKALIRELLNIDYDSFIAKLNIPDTPSPPGLFLEFLSEDKRQQVMRLIASKKEALKKENPSLLRKYSGSEDELNTVIISMITDDLGKILSSDELKEFKLRNSEIAKRLRSDFSEVDINEDEFRRIYELTEKLEAEAVVSTDNPNADESRIAKIYADYEAKLKQILGDKKYADYVKSNDPDYRYISEFSKMYDIPKDTMEKVYEFKKAFLSEIRRIEADSSLTFQQRSNIAIALMQESEKTLKSLLGDSIYNDYKDYDDDYVTLCNNLLIENTATNTQQQLETTNDTMTVPIPPWGPYPPPPPPLLRRQ